MKFELWLIGKDESYIAEGLRVFSGRIQRYISFQVKYYDAKKNSSVTATMLGSLEDKDYLVLLDERGKEFSSEKFAGLIGSLLNSGKKKAVFVIGGAYGFDDALRQRANSMVSLSKMTFSHQVVRLLFLEQLYRAFTIMKNEPYHHA